MFRSLIFGLSVICCAHFSVESAAQTAIKATDSNAYYNSAIQASGQTATSPTTATAGTSACSGCAQTTCCCPNRPILDRLRSDHCFDSFISPMTNPVFFEDPRNITEARVIFFHHQVPSETAGGTVQLMAVQLRARLSENVSLIATKDGFITSSNPLIDDGWADVAAGLKFNLLKDACRQRLLSAGFTYEMPVGSTRTLQGNGDGEFNLFATGAAKLSDRSHLISAAGFRLPLDTIAESRSFYWSNHIDLQVRRQFYLFAEANWYHWLKSGQTLAANFEGLDAFNLGSNMVTGNDIVTAAVGAKFKPSAHREIGLAWEAPLTGRRDIIDNRLTFDVIFRY